MKPKRAPASFSLGFRRGQSYRDCDGFRLGGWVSKQRQFRQQGTLVDDRARRLESLPGWVWDARQVAGAR
ncbi:MAG: helicase associated domain-containing protein [Solirubrobacterales bacterium]|nr:helicase associated domain-containing protein [Solirubrobacterales bacterium]